MRKFLASAAASAVLIGAFSAQAAETIKVTVVNGHPPVFLWVKHLTETYIPAVNKALEGTDYKIEWTENYGGTLAAVGGELEALEDGLAHVGAVPTVFEPTSLPLQNVTYFTPFSTGDAGLVMRVMDELHSSVEGLTTSWQSYDTEYLGGGFALDNYVLMTNFPVKSIDDLKGRRIAAPGPAVNWLEGTGAVGVSGNLTTYYSDIQTGVFEGAIVFPTAAAPAKLHEVAPHITRTDFGAQYAGTLVANKPWFDEQPEAVQKALQAGAKAYTEAYLQEQSARVDAAFKGMTDGGAKVFELSAEEKARWAAALPQIADTWAKDAESKGLSGDAVLEAYTAALKAAGAPMLRDWQAR